jgi:tRNA(Ile)-lysidine synthase TilS/MesJ
MDRADINHIKELKERLSQAEGKERDVLRAELAEEEEKIRMEQAIFDFEKALEQDLSSFNRYLAGAVDHLRRSPYPYDAKPYLEKARGLIKDMMHMLKEMKSLEDTLIRLTRVEKEFLKKEQKTV